MMTRNELSVERMNNDVKTVERFRYLGNALNASGGSQMTVMARTRMKWMRFQKYGNFLYGRIFSSKIEEYIRFVLDQQ